MTHLKLLTALTAFVLLTACGGATATGDSAQTTDCAANAFGASCIAEDINVEARITDCITAGNAGDTKCASLTSDTAMNTAINTCLANPFDDTCTESDFTFSTYAEMARVNRVSFCETAGNETHDLCPTFVRNCIANPFGATCGAYFESAKVPYCEANDVAGCPNVTAADWADNFTDTLATAPVSTDTANQFLSGLTDTPPVIERFDAGAVQDFGSSLTLAYNGLGGDATDGASFFFGSFDISEGVFNARYYAGIHASTDLGAPLNNVSQAGIWIGWILLDGSLSINSRFDLNVTFGTTSNGNAGTIDAFTTTGGSFRFKIDGEFNDKGVIIMGTTLVGTTSDGMTIADNEWRTPGTLTGLIGQEGVVGAFFSTTNTSNNDDTLGRQPYIGAFVARPRTPDPEPLVVNYDDWTRDFLPSLSATPDVATQAPTHKNQFLAGTTTTLTPLIQSTTPTTLFMTGSTNNGVGFFTENGAFYAGLLSNTSLGAPVAITPQASGADVMAEWEGKIRAIQVFDGNAGSGDTTTALDLDVAVNLTARTFTGTALDPNASTTSITINGLFPATDRGVVTGTVRQRSGTSDRFGQLTGLIGQNGVVGAFYSNSNVDVARRFVGGFYAAPPAN